MKPVSFPQVNCKFGPPPGMDESQVQTIPGFRGDISAGNLDGAFVVVVAWQPSEKELAQLNEGAPIFVMFMSGIVPHCLNTEFPLEKIEPT